MDIVNGMTIKGYRGRYKVISFSEDKKTIKISYNGQMPRDYEVKYNFNDDAYFEHMGKEIIIK